MTIKLTFKSFIPVALLSGFSSIPAAEAEDVTGVSARLAPEATAADAGLSF